MPDYAHRRPKDHSKKPDKETEQGKYVRREFVQSTSDCEKNRRRSQAHEQRKFSADPAPELLRVFRLPNCFRFSRHAPEHIGWASAMQLVVTQTSPPDRSSGHLSAILQAGSPHDLPGMDA